MHVTVNSQRLATELRLLNKIVPAKPAIHVLGFILLRAQEQLKLYATDLEVGLLTTCSATIHAPGTVVLPAVRFLQMVEQFADGDVSISSEKAQVVVRCGAFTSRLQVQAADDFPEPPAVEGMASTMDAAALRRLIGRVRCAVDASSTKYILKGALLTLAGPVAAMAATDGKRLSLATDGRTGPDARVVIPVKTLDVLVSGSDSGDVELTVSQRHLFFQLGNRLLVSRTIDGEFPKYDKIVPRDNDKAIVADRLALAAALRRVRLVDEENKAVWLSIAADAVELTSSSAEVGSANESVKVAYDGAPLKICINVDYLLDFLNAATRQTVTIKLKDAKSPALLMDGDDHVAVIMTMRS